MTTMNVIEVSSVFRAEALFVDTGQKSNQHLSNHRLVFRTGENRSLLAAVFVSVPFSLWGGRMGPTQKTAARMLGKTGVPIEKPRGAV